MKYSKARQISHNNVANNKQNINKRDTNNERPKRKNINNINKNKYFNTENNIFNNPNKISNYNIPMNFPNFPMLYTPYASTNFPYMPFGLNGFNSINNIQNYNNTYTNNNFSINNSFENTQESSSEDKNYYEHFGDNYYDSLQKGIKDISQLYNENKINRPKISLLCHYYCNLDKNQEDEEYIQNEIQKLGNNLRNILDINTDDSEK